MNQPQKKAIRHPYNTRKSKCHASISLLQGSDLTPFGNICAIHCSLFPKINWTQMGRWCDLLPARFGKSIDISQSVLLFKANHAVSIIDYAYWS